MHYSIGKDSAPRENVGTAGQPGRLHEALHSTFRPDTDTLGIFWAASDDTVGVSYDSGILMPHWQDPSVWRGMPRASSTVSIRRKWGPEAGARDQGTPKQHFTSEARRIRAFDLCRSTGGNSKRSLPLPWLRKQGADSLLAHSLGLTSSEASTELCGSLRQVCLFVWVPHHLLHQT